MPDTPEFDPEAWQRLTKLGGTLLLEQMIDLFLEHAAERVAAAVAAARAGDARALNRAVHSLKSSAANLGAVAVQNFSERLEQTSAGTELGDVPTLMADLEAAFARAVTRLEQEKGRLHE